MLRGFCGTGRAPTARGRMVLALTTALTVSLVVAACDTSRLSPWQDTRVRIVEPDEGATVTLPVTLRWEVHGFRVTGKDGRNEPDAGYFAVFVDRAPIPPGKSLQWYVLQDESCGDTACGTMSNLADVYSTDKTTVKLTSLPAVDESGHLEGHEAVVVLLDGTGTRIGESAFYVRFNFERRN